MFIRLFKIFNAFSAKERRIFGVAFLLFVLTSLLLLIDFFEKNTEFKAVFGGEYREGIIGQPTLINPVLLGSNDADRDLVQLLFKNILDLSESHKESSDGRIWTIRLKEDIFWDDGVPITSDDVIFTVQTIKNPDSRSYLFPVWEGIEALRDSEREVKFILPNTYVFFAETLKDLRPIPKHIFGSLPPANLRLSNYNLEPVGNGPLKFDSFVKKNDGFIMQYNFTRNERYFDKKTYLDKLVIRFYQNEKDVISAINMGQIDGSGGISAEGVRLIRVRGEIRRITLPRYYALFLNSYLNPALKDKNVRLALNLATGKNNIINNVFKGEAIAVEGPLLSDMPDYAPQLYHPSEFSLTKASEILEAGGWRKGDSGIREKLVVADEAAAGKSPVKLEFNLVVPENKFLVDTAKLIAADWARIGIKLNVKIVALAEVSDNFLKSRDYEMLIFGHIFGYNPDLFSFWHSSERFYPGLNLALYDNATADALIESIRKNLNKEARRRDFASLQSLIIEDSPAIFLFSPYYLYFSRNWLQGFDANHLSFAGQRFQNISEWYVKTVRVFKQNN